MSVRRLPDVAEPRVQGNGAASPDPVRNRPRPLSPSTAPHELRRMGPALYAVATLLVVMPLFDLATNVWPARIGDAAWRYGALGLLASFMLTPLLGAGMAMGVAALLGQGRVTRALGWLSVLGGGILVLSSGLFLLDAVQIRSGVGPGAIRTFDIGVLKAVVKFVVFGGGFVWLGIAGVRRGRPHR